MERARPGVALKRSIGRRVMSSKLEQIFDATRTQMRERSVTAPQVRRCATAVHR